MRIAIGTAKRINERLGVVAEINAIDGRYDIGATNSNNDYQGIGATAGFGYKFTPNLTGQFIGFYNHSVLSLPFFNAFSTTYRYTIKGDKLV